MSKLILIIDDDVDDRSIFARYLEFVGASVAVAGDAEEGVRLAIEHAPSLILLTLGSATIDGWGTMRRLQLDRRSSAIPVVAMSSDPVDADRLEFAGFCGSVTGPLSPFRLLEEVERCLGALRTPYSDGSGFGGGAR